MRGTIQDFKVGQWGRYLDDRLVRCLKDVDRSGDYPRVKVSYWEDGYPNDATVLLHEITCCYENRFANWTEAKQILTNRLKG